MKILLCLTCLIGLLMPVETHAQSDTRDTLAIDRLYNQSRKYWYSDRDSAFYYLKKVESSAEKIKYQRGVAYAYYGYAILENVMYRKFQYYVNALGIFEATGDKFGIGITLLKIGDIYAQIGQPEKSLEYYKSALTVKREINDIGGIALALISIGQYYENKHDFDKALNYFKESLVYRRRENTRRGIGYAQVNIGNSLHSLQRVEEALAIADSAIYNFSTTDDQVGKMWSLNVKANALKKLGRNDEAIAMFKAIDRFPPDYQHVGLVMPAKLELISHYLHAGDINRAFQLQSEYLVAKDSISARDYRTETQRLVNEYEFATAEQKAQREKSAMEKELSRRNSLEFLIIAVIVAGLFATLISSRKNLTEKVVNWSLLVCLLLFFEFLLVLTDSSVEKITGGEPILKLLANVLLALLILPGHQFLESYTRARLLKSK